MAEYIDRERLIMDILGLTIVDPAVAQYADAVLQRLKDTPAADVVEVVRCKDCKHYSYSKLCFYHGIRINEYAFCSYGERKEKMTFKELKLEAKRQGYNLIPAHKEKFLPCLCGANLHQYTSGPNGNFYSCKICGLEAPPVSKNSGRNAMVKAWNQMIRERKEK